jgi:hypothetical protein
VNGVQALYNERHVSPPLTLSIVQLDILSDDSSSSPAAAGDKVGSVENKTTDEPAADDDIMNYLKNFCSWAAKRNPVSTTGRNAAATFVGDQTVLWDHAVLITGRDLMIDG